MRCCWFCIIVKIVRHQIFRMSKDYLGSAFTPNGWRHTYSNTASESTSWGDLIQIIAPLSWLQFFVHSLLMNYCTPLTYKDIKENLVRTSMGGRICHSTVFDDCSWFAGDEALQFKSAHTWERGPAIIINVNKINLIHHSPIEYQHNLACWLTQAWEW